MNPFNEAIDQLWTSRTTLGKILFLPFWLFYPFIWFLDLLVYLDEKTKK